MALERMGTLATDWLSLLCLAASLFGCVCALGAAWAARWFVRRPASAVPTTWSDVSILKPLSGMEAQLSQNIETYFHQDYPGDVQFVFGVQDPDDGAIPIIRALMERYPGLDLELVVNGATHGSNRKVSNLINMGRVARHPLIVLADSDVAVGPDYLRTLAGGPGRAWRRGGHLPLSGPVERRLLVAAVRHGHPRSFPARRRRRAGARPGASPPWPDGRAQPGDIGADRRL
jgi:hypothetical protein